jgi:dihydrofolate reductase
MWKREKHQLLQLVICGSCFVLLVLTKLVLPDYMEKVNRTISAALSQNMDVQAVFSSVGKVFAGETELAKTADRATVIGGGSIYRQMLPYCDTAYVTKVHCTPVSDTFFPNLEEDPDWFLAEVLQSGEENGISYEMCLYKRKGTA